MLDALSCFEMLSSIDDAVPDEPPFEVQLIARSRGATPTASGLTLPVERSIDDPGRTDIAIVPSLLVRDRVWERGRYPELVAWLRRVHGEGAMV